MGGLAGAAVTHQLCQYAMRVEKATMRQTVVDFNRARREQGVAKGDVPQATLAAAPKSRSGESPDAAVVGTESSSRQVFISKPWYRWW